MIIGLAQMDIIWENVDENKKKAEYFFQEAAKKGVDLLVFPEMTLTGFSMNVMKTALCWKEQKELFQNLTDKYQMCAAFGYPAPVAQEENIKGGKNYQNHLSVMDCGKEILNYSKIHPFAYGLEARYFRGGDKIVTAEWKDTILGAFVCYDLRFPEIFQIASRQAEIILVIANWPAERIEQWECLLRARAIENQSFMVGLNRTGDGGNIHYNGHSVIYGPKGERLTFVTEEEELLTARIETGCVRKYREEFPTKKDRRDDLYRFYI